MKQQAAHFSIDNVSLAFLPADFTPGTAFAEAFTSRNMTPPDGLVSCPCCNDTGLDRDDLATTATFKDYMIAAIEARYHRPICNGCADAHDTCAECGEAFLGSELRYCGTLDLHFCDGCSCTTDSGEVEPLNDGWLV